MTVHTRTHVYMHTRIQIYIILLQTCIHTQGNCTENMEQHSTEHWQMKHPPLFHACARLVACPTTWGVPPTSEIDVNRLYPHIAPITWNIPTYVYIIYIYMQIGGFNPSAEYEFVTWGYYSQYTESHKKNLPVTRNSIRDSMA